MADLDHGARLRETLTLAGIASDGPPGQSLGRDPSETRSVRTRETVPAADPVPSGGQQPTTTLESLPPVSIRAADAGLGANSHEFQVLRTLGQGGMGRVELARQPGLDRNVAVKRLRSNAPSSMTGRALIREARLMGGLEHPNIPPIYVLGRSDREPVLAMKRIEGVSWAERLAELEHGPAAEQRHEQLVSHLEILIQVCQAVHFAHSHQTLHLDIKPDNVMLGRFGEVYLIDWGVAHRLDELAQLRSIDATDEPARARVVGTPAYMAPEMVQGLGLCSPATDVYLLGASLHEVLTGQPRHLADTTLSAMVMALESEPFEYPEEVDDELASIVNRACHQDPGQRFESSEALRQALADYLRLRSSLALSEVAERSLHRLREHVAAGVAGDDPSPPLRSAFSECRFGFDQAIAEAPHNERAQRGRNEAYALMLEAEFSARNAGAVEGLLAALDQPSPDFTDRLRRLREELEREAEERSRLEAIAREFQPRDASWARTASIAMGSMMWLVLMGGIGLCARTGWVEVTPMHNLVIVGCVMGIPVAMSLVRRDLFLHNRVIQQTSTLVMISGLLLVANRVVAVLLDQPLWQTAIGDALVMAMLFGGVEIVIGKLLHGAAIVVVLGASAVVVSLVPEHAYELIGVLFAAINFKLAWDLRPQLDELEARASTAPDRG